MASTKPFFVDGFTVDQILNLGDDILNKLDTRDLSRAVRTTALAANKRLNRLKAQAKKQGGKYIEKKSAKHSIAMDALNSVTNNGTIPGSFGVSGKNRNELRAELARIKHFMDLKTSTIKGAELVRKAREKRLFGKTREEAMKKAKKDYQKKYKKETGRKAPKKNIKKILDKIEEDYKNKPSKAWEIYNKYQEREHLQDKSTSSYYKGYGYEQVIEEVGEMIMNDEPEENILQRAMEIEEEAYLQEEDEYLREIDSSWGLSIDMSDDPFEF